MKKYPRKKNLFPEIIIAGAMKCGKTALHHILESHPDIFITYNELNNMPDNSEIRELLTKFDTRLNARAEYEKRIASKDLILDIGGRNNYSRSYKKLRSLSGNPKVKILSTDILPQYNPDVVDDICESSFKTDTFDAIYCDAILEHVRDYRSALKNMHRILKNEGEIFIYVPFYWCLHDKVDYHRFTAFELDLMLKIFSEYKLCLPDQNGYGGVFWQILSFYKFHKYPQTWASFSKATNMLISVLFKSRFFLKRKQHKKNISNSIQGHIFYYTHLFVNHGFCAWGKK